MYRKRYKKEFDQELPDCQFKGNKSKIKNLIRKVYICADGIECNHEHKKNPRRRGVLFD